MHNMHNDVQITIPVLAGILLLFRKDDQKLGGY